MTAAELGHQRKRVVRISTGSKQLDAILGGYAVFASFFQFRVQKLTHCSGFQSMSISEVRWLPISPDRANNRINRCTASFVSHNKRYRYPVMANSLMTSEGCGKTQLSHTMSVIAQVSCDIAIPHSSADPSLDAQSKSPSTIEEYLLIYQEFGGASGKVAYIGTASDVDPGSVS